MLLGVQEFEKGDVKNGMKNLLKSVASNKSNDKAWNNLGKALLMAGAKDKALSCFQTALKINPSNKIAKESINSIQTSNEKQ
jgi:Tfp pilus assembly protein PilF